MSTSSTPLIGPSLKKSSSDKRFKLPSGVEHNRPGKMAFEVEAETQEGEEISKEEQQEVEVDVDVAESDDTAVTSLQEQNGGEDADDDLELPPPMKPITEPILVTTANGPSGSTIPSELPGKRVNIPSCLLSTHNCFPASFLSLPLLSLFDTSLSFESLCSSLPNVRQRFLRAAPRRPISRRSSRL